MLSKESLQSLKLCEGSMRTGDSIVHNGGWYNSFGNKIGWGDLNAKDYVRIQSKLQPGELFVILSERDSFWEFVTENAGVGGFMCKTKPEEQNPGVSYLAKKARWVIASDMIYYSADYPDNYDHGFPYKNIPREQVATLLAGGK